MMALISNRCSVVVVMEIICILKSHGSIRQGINLKALGYISWKSLSFIHEMWDILVYFLMLAFAEKVCQ